MHIYIYICLCIYIYMYIYIYVYVYIYIFFCIYIYIYRYIYIYIYIYMYVCVCHCHVQRFSGSAFNVQTETLRTEKVDLLSPDRAVEVTEVAQAKKEAKLEECGTKQQEDSESIFSAALLPVSFYSDLIKGHSCRAVILALRSMFFHVLSPLQL